MYNCLASVPSNPREFDEMMVAYAWFSSFGHLNNTFICCKKYCDYKKLSIMYHKSNYYNYNDYFVVPKYDKTHILYYVRNQKDDKYIKSYVKNKYKILISFIKTPWFYNRVIMYNIITYNNYRYALFYTCDSKIFKKLRDKLKDKKISYCYIVMKRKLFYKFIKDYRIKDIKSIISEYEKIKNSGNDNYLKIWKYY